jgi:mannan endo-1,4-beta-mannosidase
VALATAVACAVALAVCAPPAQAQDDSSSSAITLADPQASASTRSLYLKLRDNHGKILFGHQQDTDNFVTTDEQNQGTNSDVYAVAGQYPGLWGQDSGTESNPNVLASDAIKADENGAVMTLSSHWDNPATDGPYNDTSRVVDCILPGGDLNAKFNQQLDIVAEAAHQSVRADGTPIPIIYRPLHENDGSWFWWGSGHATNGEYIELFRYVVDYLRDAKNVHNLLYSYCGYTMNAYPGDDYVDIIGTDIYDDATTLEGTREWMQQAVSRLEKVSDWAQEHGKLLALTEFGKLMHQHDGDNPNPRWFTELLAQIKASPKASRIAYMMTWANWDTGQVWTPWPGTSIADDFKAFSQDPAIAMASGSPLDYSTDVATAQPKPTIRLVNPNERTRIEQSPTAVYARINGKATPSRVYFTVQGDKRQHELTKDAQGYYTSSWDIDSSMMDGQLRTMRVVAATAQGELSSQTNVILGAQAERSRGTIDGFDEYADDTDLRQTWTPNHFDSAGYSLANDGAGGKALKIDWDFNASPDYLGVGRGFPAGEDWSGFDGLQLNVTSAANGHKFVVQLSAGGITFEAYPSLDTAVDGIVRIPFSNFAPAGWESAEHKSKTLNDDTLKKIGGFNFYLNDGDKEFKDPWTGGTRPRSGTITVDNIRCVDLSTEKARDALLATIENAARYMQKDYTAKSWETFSKALNAARTIANRADASKDGLEAADSQLRSAVAALETKSEGETGSGSGSEPGTTPEPENGNDEHAHAAGSQVPATGNVTRLANTGAVVSYAATAFGSLALVALTLLALARRRRS